MNQNFAGVVNWAGDALSHELAPNLSTSSSTIDFDMTDTCGIQTKDGRFELTDVEKAFGILEPRHFRAAPYSATAQPWLYAQISMLPVFRWMKRKNSSVPNGVFPAVRSASLMTSVSRNMRTGDPVARSFVVAISIQSLFDRDDHPPFCCRPTNHFSPRMPIPVS